MLHQFDYAAGTCGYLVWDIDKGDNIGLNQYHPTDGTEAIMHLEVGGQDSCGFEYKWDEAGKEYVMTFASSSASTSFLQKAGKKAASRMNSTRTVR